MQKFVLIATQRTGSNMVVSMLSSCPDVFCFGELFRKDLSRLVDLQEIESIDGRFFDREYRDNHFSDYLDTVFSTKRGISFLGFKLMLTQNQDVLEHVACSEAYRILLLYRENLLACYSSQLIAKATGQGIARLGEKVETQKVEFSESRFERYATRRVNAYAHFRKRLRDLNRSFLDIEYQEAASSAGASKILEYVGAEATSIPDAQTRKRNSPDIVSRFINPGDVKSYLHRNGLQDWAFEDP